MHQYFWTISVNFYFTCRNDTFFRNKIFENYKFVVQLSKELLQIITKLSGPRVLLVFENIQRHFYNISCNAGTNRETRHPFQQFHKLFAATDGRMEQNFVARSAYAATCILLAHFAFKKKKRKKDTILFDYSIILNVSVSPEQERSSNLWLAPSSIDSWTYCCPV